MKKKPGGEPSVQVHSIPPVWDVDSQVLILGSFPSVRSREAQFFYGHPQNRFWKVLTAVLGLDALPLTTDTRKTALLLSHVALWDVIASCEVTGSSDSSIRSVVPNDVREILCGARIRQIFCNGHTAYTLYTRHLLPLTGREAVCLPSTSPANASFTLERLCSEWAAIRNVLGSC